MKITKKIALIAGAFFMISAAAGFASGKSDTTEEKKVEETKNESESKNTDAFTEAGKTVGEVGKEIGNTGKEIGNAGKEAGKEIGNAAKAFGQGVKEAFTADDSKKN
ncbi:hypothetical protein [Treponema sp.]|uniref:hypothetical protein n=1 Tax=Treponema sp. TaxID=166 RepID=UPI00388FFFF6